MGLEEADYGMTEMALGRGQTNPGDENLLVKFFSKPKENPAKTLEAGRPIFDEVDYIDIRVPGSKDSLYVQPARQNDIERFPEHYRRYKARISQEALSGTPLTEWPGVTRSQVEEFKFVNVHTMEQLIAMSDTHSQKFMGINALKAKAKAYLEASSDQAAANALIEAKKQLADQQALNQQLMDRLSALESGQQTASPDEQAAAPRRRARAVQQE